MKIQIRKNAEFKLLYFELGVWGVDPKVVAQKISEVAESLSGPETVLLRGQGPVWVYAMLTHAAHACPNVATFEPRKEGYVVATCHNGRWLPGEVIPAATVGMMVDGGKIVGGDEFMERPRMVISVGGPAHSGKSVFLAELYRQLLTRMPGEVFLQRACPDGEGMWSAESDPSLVKAIRQKGKFTENFCSWLADAIQGLKRGFKITLLDLGGKRLPPNDEVLRHSTHLLVLSSNEEA